MSPRLAQLLLLVIVHALVGTLAACSDSSGPARDVAVDRADSTTPDSTASDVGPLDVGPPDTMPDTTPPDTLCLDPVQIRVVISADFNQGSKDANCRPIDREKWLDGIDPGESMFIVGGVHEESPISDPDRTLSNLFGDWAPNTVQMYDDGTHGDEVAQDGVWTIAFSLPRGLRIGYKFTWGHAGDGWTGTEEWPGNMRLLEIVDVDGDGFVYRADYFGDETTNKDEVNLNTNGTGSITWTTDVDEDGVPDCQERQIDTDGDCLGDTWHTPTGIGHVPCS